MKVIKGDDIRLAVEELSNDDLTKEELREWYAIPVQDMNSETYERFMQKKLMSGGIRKLRTLQAKHNEAVNKQRAKAKKKAKARKARRNR